MDDSSNYVERLATTVQVALKGDRVGPMVGTKTIDGKKVVHEAATVRAPRLSDEERQARRARNKAKKQRRAQRLTGGKPGAWAVVDRKTRERRVRKHGKKVARVMTYAEKEITEALTKHIIVGRQDGA